MDLHHPRGSCYRRISFLDWRRQPWQLTLLERQLISFFQRLFSRETSQVSRRSIVEEPTPVKVSKRADALAGIPLESAPPLGGYGSSIRRGHTRIS